MNLENYQLIEGQHDLLTTSCERFDFNNPPCDPSELATHMAKIMRDEGGIGLAANQIGLPYRVFALRGDPNHVLFNPRIVDTDPEQIVLVEGCLTFPGLYVKIKRSKSVRIRYQQANGETVTQRWTGMTARVVLHEMDHLDGILFYTRANRYHRDKAFRKWEIWKRRNGS